MKLSPTRTKDFPTTITCGVQRVALIYGGDFGLETPRWEGLVWMEGSCTRLLHLVVFRFFFPLVWSLIIDSTLVSSAQGGRACSFLLWLW